MAAAGRLHELQIVDDDEAEVAETAALGVHIGDGEHGIVVHADVRLAQLRGGSDDAVPLCGRESAHGELLAVDHGGGGQQTLHKLLAAHLEREDRDGLARMLADVAREIERHTRFALTGTGGDEDQLALLEAHGDLIEIGHAGAEAGNAAAVHRGVREGGIHPLDDHGNRLQSADVAALTQLIDLALRGLEDGIGLARALGDEGLDLIGGLLQIAQQRLIAHDGGILEHVRRRGRETHDLHEILLGGRLAEDAAHLHLIHDGDGVDLLAEGEHAEDRLKDLAVGLDIKFFCPHLVDDVRHTGGVDQHGADDRLFRSRVVGGLTTEKLFHESSSFMMETLLKLGELRVESGAEVLAGANI